jgi:hypothetical protein
VLGTLGLYGLGSVLAIIFGYVARGRIRDARGVQSGDGLAVAGILLGYVGLTVAVVLLTFGLPG